MPNSTLEGATLPPRDPDLQANNNPQSTLAATHPRTEAGTIPLTTGNLAPEDTPGSLPSLPITNPPHRATRVPILPATPGSVGLTTGSYPPGGMPPWYPSPYYPPWYPSPFHFPYTTPAQYPPQEGPKTSSHPVTPHSAYHRSSQGSSYLARQPGTRSANPTRGRTNRTQPSVRL